MGGDSYSDTRVQNEVQPGLFDSKWGYGYKNDGKHLLLITRFTSLVYLLLYICWLHAVWRMAEVTWSVRADVRLKSEYGRKIPVTTSELTWEEVTQGLHPPKGVSNGQWIACQPFFQNVSPFCLRFMSFSVFS